MSEEVSIGGDVLFLDTHKSTRPHTPYSTSWHISDRHYRNLRGFALKLEHAQLSNSVFPINEYNNRIYFQELSSAGVVTESLIPEGHYETLTAYAGAIAAVMTTDSPNGLTYTYSVNSANLIITITGTSVFRFREGVNDALNNMGFVRPNSNHADFVTSHTGAAPADISGTHYIDIVSNIPTNSYSPGAERNYVFARIPVSAGYGNTIFYQASEASPMLVTQERLDQIEIFLFDQNGNPFKLPQNRRLSMQFKVFYF